MESICPACKKEPITYWNKFLMHGVFKTKCPNCNSILGTTPKWEAILWGPSILLWIILFTITMMDYRLYSFLVLLFGLTYVFIIYRFMPLTVKELKRADGDRSHIEI
jgi:signal transduction histidine kinase